MFYERQRMARPTLDEKELKRRIAAAAVADGEWRDKVILGTARTATVEALKSLRAAAPLSDLVWYSRAGIYLAAVARLKELIEAPTKRKDEAAAKRIQKELVGLRKFKEAADKARAKAKKEPAHA
jgi:hypothetical protein